MKGKIFPIIIVVLFLSAAGEKALVGDIKMFIFYLASAVINAVMN